MTKVLILLLIASCARQGLVPGHAAPSKHVQDLYDIVGPGECFYIDWPRKSHKLCMTDGTVFVPEKLKTTPSGTKK